MKILLKNTNEILSDKLSLEERGALITILLLKDIEPKITLAKVKSKINLTKSRHIFIKLHEEGFIDWSGYKGAKNKLEQDEISPQIVEIMDFMRSLYKRNFKNDSSAVKTNLKKRLSENSIEDIKLVIANRYSVWKDDSKMCGYLRPETIFQKSKFDKYLIEAKHSKNGASFVEAEDIGLKNGDEITSKEVKRFTDKETYTIKVYSLNDAGECLGSGMESVRYGKDLKNMIKIQDNNERLGGRREYKYYYIQK